MIRHHSFSCPSKIIIGGSSSEMLPDHVQSLAGSKVLIVTDSYFETSGLAGHFRERLEEADISATVFSGVQPDPATQNVTDGLEILKMCGADVIVGLGGDSSLDAAKAISCASVNPLPLAQYKGYQNIPHRDVPVITFPTTVGTGSEVTQGAVITDTESDVKMVFMDPYILPAIALIDYKLSMSMPRSLTAYVGMDTLSHGIEAFVSIPWESVSNNRRIRTLLHQSCRSAP